MGTSLYKGGTVKYHSISQNILITSKSYKYSNGYFGESSPSTGSRTRNIASSDNIARLPWVEQKKFIIMEIDELHKCQTVQLLHGENLQHRMAHQ